MKIPRALAKYIDVVNHPGYYVKTEVDRIKKTAKAQALEIVAKAVVFGAMGFVAFFLLVFASITLGLFLNSVLNSSFYGFLIVTGLYFLTLLGIFLFRKSIERAIKGKQSQTDKQPASRSPKHLEEVSTVVTTDPTSPTNGRVETTYVTRQDV